MWPLTVLICLLVQSELSCRWTVDVLADWLEILLEHVQAREGVDALHHVSVGVFAQLLLHGSGLYENVKRIIHSTSGKKRH